MRARPMAATMVSLLLMVIATAAPAAGGDESKGEQTVGVTVETPGLLALEVDHDVTLGTRSPGATTADVGFHIGIVNTTSEGWELYVSATDFESYTMECDDQGGNCVRVATDPVHTIAAGNLYIRGGMDAALASAQGIATSEGYFGGSGTPFLLLQGTSDAAGTLGITDPQPFMRLDVPADAVDGDYTATLTYTIMATAP